MISVTKFKAHFLELFRVMRDTPGMYIDVHNRGHVYRIHVQDMKRRFKFRDNVVEYKSAIEADKCPKCSKLMLNGICMSKGCTQAI